MTISKFENADGVLPPITIGKEEFWFYRDPAKKDTFVVTDGEGNDHYFVNPFDWQDGIFEMQFGASGTTRLLVCARSFEDALEEAGDWLSDFAPGHLSDLSEEYKDALKDAREELGENADEAELNAKAQEIAETDMTYTESGYINSSEWWGNEARDPVNGAAEYAAQALEAAQFKNYDMIPALPLGKGQGERVELEEADVLKMFADADLGLTSAEVQKIVGLKEEQTVDLKGFRLERVG